MRRSTPLLVLAILAAAPVTMPLAQFNPPIQVTPVDPATLFTNQCGTCHSVKPNDAPRQGPNLNGVFGRKAGSLPGFKYSAGFAQADFVWDEPHLDAYLTNPQAMIKGGIMAYRQANPATRKAIIVWLKEQK
jgi:cytochrome c